MTIWKPSGTILIGSTEFKTDAPVINYTEGPKWNAASLYCQPVNGAHKCTQMGAEGGQMPWSLAVPRKSAKRYSSRPALRSSKWGLEGANAPYEAVRPLIKQFVFHHDGCATSAMCFDVLQNERGFSCHFLIDNDGTIYQTLNLALMAFHAANANSNTIGVELCNRGDAKKEPHYYSGNRFGPQRDAKPAKINGHTYLAFDYTAAQYDSLTKLSKALTRIFPNLPAEYPQKSPGVQTWDTMPESASAAFSGFIGHYHLTQRKWDPGYFDFADFCRKLRGDFCYVVWPEPPKDKTTDRPIIPNTKSEVEAGSNKLFAMNEGKADAGFFPVGPWGESRLWHGGVHLTGEVNHEVFAPFPGRVVAVRMGPNTPVGSTNFVLLRHQLSLGERKVEFYTLYMHLGDEPTLKVAKPAAWLGSDGWKKGGTKFDNGVIGLDESIEAGSVIGHVNTAGPDDLSRPQVHVELFSKSDLFPEGTIPGSPWKVLDGSGGGRFCDVPEILGLIDSNADSMLKREELTAFYGAGSAAGTRYFVTYNVSEWTYEPSWPEALKLPKDMADKKPDEIDAQYEEQIKPGLWWSGPVAQHAKLPPDGIVYHYHPVAFVSWFNVQMREAQAAAKKAGTLDFKKELAEVPPEGVTDDFNDLDGSSMKASTEDQVDPCNEQITLKELVEGFDAPECGADTP